MCLHLSLQVNSDYDSTFVFENDFPALQPDAPDPGQCCFWCSNESAVTEHTRVKHLAVWWLYSLFVGYVCAPFLVARHILFLRRFHVWLNFFFRFWAASVVPVESCQGCLVRTCCNNYDYFHKYTLCVTLHQRAKLETVPLLTNHNVMHMKQKINVYSAVHLNHCSLIKYNTITSLSHSIWADECSQSCWGNSSSLLCSSSS